LFQRYLVEQLEDRTLLSFGLTTSTNLFTVDTGAQVVFSVSRTTASSAAVGDLTSVKYNGVEMEAPHASTSRYSHYESGLSSTAVVSATEDPSGNWIVISCDDTGSAGVGVIQYYMARKGDDNVYMATYAPSTLGEMRFLMYLNWNIFTNHPPQSDTSGGQMAIESTDVFGDASGQTHSKYYGEVRFIDSLDYGATGSTGGQNYGAFMFGGNRETSAGGPFFKDIDFQSTGASVELYNYLFSGHSQTETFRTGLYGPYALQITNGSAPTSPDYSFIDSSLALSGFVPASGRGTLVGNANGVPSGHQATVGLSNSVAQYWATPDASGNYSITGVKPGTYVEKLYQDELAVGTLSAVTISAGATMAQNITDTFFTPAAASTIFRIGSWDGTPIGFLNADKIQDMHPTDTRMSAWGPDSTGLTNYTVGTSSDSTWPMAEWKYQNTSAPFTDTDNRITFTLTSTQATTPMTLRIGLTRANGDGGAARPVISVNGGSSSSAPSPSTQAAGRGVTLGNWRGNNVLYTYNISTSSLHSGTNTIDIFAVSGNSNTGDAWLGPWYIYDALDLVTTSSLTNQPVVKTISVTPGAPPVFTGDQQAFTATAKDQNGNPIAANFLWTSTRGSVDGTGLYTAPSTGGSDNVTATSGTIAGSTSVNVQVLSTITGTQGTDAITLTRSGANLNVFVDSSSPTYSVPMSDLGQLSIAGLNGNDTITLDFTNGDPIPTAAITISGGTGSSLLNIQGAAGADAITIASGNFTFSASNASAASLTINAGATLTMNALQSVNSLSVGGRVNVSANGASPLLVHSLNLTGGTIDLANNSMIIDYSGASPAAVIRANLVSGFNSGKWNGAGIDSSNAASDAAMMHAIGYAEASDLGVTNFLGKNVDSTALLLRYTKYGDNNLDGTVDIGNDFALLLDGLATANANSWIQGDYTYDNKVDLGNDFNLFLGGYLSGKTLGPMLAAPVVQSPDANVFSAAPSVVVLDPHKDRLSDDGDANSSLFA
jgi:rhamnogalacturonan endolyase